jgi:hypothetical protein
MHDFERYQDNAAGCLLASRNAHQPHCKRLNLLMAQAWLSLATEDTGATDDLLAKWEADENAEDIALAAA